MTPPPPQPLPDHLWGETWTFVTLPAADLEEGLLQRPIPTVEVAGLPSQVGVDASAVIPGVVIEAGRRSLKLARWLQAQQPLYLGSVLAELNGLLLNTKAQERWILMTYQDPEMVQAAKAFEERKLQVKGLHFLLIQPDESTQSGIWVLRR